MNGPDLAAAGSERGRYTMTAHWYPHGPDDWERERDLPGYQPGPHVTEYDTLDEAENEGQHFGCMRGVARVEVHGPDGTLQALWDKRSQVVVKRRLWLVGGRMRYDVSRVANRWQSLGAESKTLHRAKVRQINTAMREEMAAGRRIDPSRIAERLRAERDAGSPSGGIGHP